jgi:DNA-binding response OmpR family regulator
MWLDLRGVETYFTIWSAESQGTRTASTATDSMHAMNAMEETIMGYTPAVEGFETFQPVLERPLPSDVTGTQTSRAALRYGGLSMDALSGAVTYRGTAVKLSVPERELLGALLRRAGQIVSCEHLAAAIGSTTSTVDERMVSLRTSLKRAGASTLPYDVNGLGYVLWRC